MKGVIFTLEAVIAGTILITFLVFIVSNFSPPPQEGDLTIRAYEILEGLDNQGILRNYTVNQDFDGLNSQVKFFSANHSIQICDLSGSCVGTIPNASDIFTGTYIIAGNESYNPFYVKLYLWRS